MQIRTVARAVALSAASVLALAACSSGSATGGGQLNAGAPAAPKSVKIGFIGPLSGDYQQLGLNEFQGIELAVNEINKNNTAGFQVELIKGDDQGDPSKTPAAAALMLQQQDVLGIVGPAFSGSVKAVGETLSDGGLTFVTPSATNATLQDLKFSQFHRVVPNDNVEGKHGADWLATKGIGSVFVVDDLGDYGKGVADAVQGELALKGVTVTRQGVDAKTTDYSVIAQQVKSSGAGALFYGGYDAQAGLFAKSLKAVGYTGITLTGNGAKSTVFTDSAGAAGDGWYFLCGCQDANTAPSAKDFTARYVQAYNEPPSTFSPESFDATNALVQAIKNAAAAGPLTRASVAKALQSIDYVGIATRVKFDANGDLAASAVTVNLYQQTGGKFVSLGNVDELK